MKITIAFILIFFAALFLGTLLLTADTPGALNFQVIGASLVAFGLTPGDVQFSANAAAANVVPEPGTAAMVGLGLLGLASVGRRRR